MGFRTVPCPGGATSLRPGSSFKFAARVRSGQGAGSGRYIASGPSSASRHIKAHGNHRPCATACLGLASELARRRGAARASRWPRFSKGRPRHLAAPPAKGDTHEEYAREAQAVQGVGPSTFPTGAARGRRWSSPNQRLPSLHPVCVHHGLELRRGLRYRLRPSTASPLSDRGPVLRLRGDLLSPSKENYQWRKPRAQSPKE